MRNKVLVSFFFLLVSFFVNAKIDSLSNLSGFLFKYGINEKVIPAASGYMPTIEALFTIQVISEKQIVDRGYEREMVTLPHKIIKENNEEKYHVISEDRQKIELVLGIGITEEKINEIFELFYGTKVPSVYITGLGLGLYICRDFVHNEIIRV